MKLPCPVKKGFTLIELLVVVSILAIVSGIMIPSFSNYTRNQTLKQAQENLKSDLRSIQNKALTGTGSDTLISGNPALYWGFSYASNATSYGVHLVSSACDSNSLQQTVNLPSGITFGSAVGTHCLLFRMSDGMIYEGANPIAGNPLTIPLLHTSSASVRNIYLVRTGLIYGD